MLMNFCSRSLAIAALSLISTISLEAKAIAFTFNDTPGYNSEMTTPLRRMQSILHTLKENKIRAAFFFTGLRGMSIEGRELLNLIDKEGHVIGNNGEGQRASNRELEETQQHIIDTDFALSHWPCYRRWYRFPHLDYGNRVILGGSEIKRRQIVEFLKNESFIDARITINTLDWYVDKVFLHEYRRQQAFNRQKLDEAYVHLVLAWANHFDKIYTQTLGHSPTHTIVLLVNDLNTMFLSSIIKALRQDGWEFKSPEEAYKEDWVQYPQTLAERYNSSSKNKINAPYLSSKEVDEFLSSRSVFVNE